MSDRVTRPAHLPADRPWPPHIPERIARLEDCSAGEINVVGRLIDRGTLRHSPVGGPSVLSFELQTGKGLPFVVSQAIPNEPRAIRDAELQVVDLERGRLARISARGARLRIDHHTEALSLVDVTSVELVPEE